MQILHLADGGFSLANVGAPDQACNKPGPFLQVSRDDVLGSRISSSKNSKGEDFSWDLGLTLCQGSSQGAWTCRGSGRVKFGHLKVHSGLEDSRALGSRAQGSETPAFQNVTLRSLGLS